MKILSIWDEHYESEKILESGLRTEGHTVYSVVRKLVEDQPILDPWVKYQKKVTLIENDKSNFLRTVMKFFSLMYFIKFTRSEIKRIKPDILVCHFGQTGSRFVRMADRMGIPIAVLFYGYDISAALNSKRWLRKYKKFARYPCTLIVMCEEARARLVGLGCQPLKIKCWNLPIYLDKFPYETRFRSGLRIKAITCARFVEKKGYPILLNTIARLREEKIEVELNALGYGGDFQLLVDLSKKLGISDLVFWHRDYTGDAFRKKYLELLQSSDVFVMVSEKAKNGDDEGGPPLSVISAQATGIPIISTRFTGYEITIEQGKTGFLCDLPIEDSLVKYIEEFAQNPEPFFKVGAAGASRARQEFDHDTQCGKLVELLTECLPQK